MMETKQVLAPSKELLSDVNGIYEGLDKACARLSQALTHKGFSCKIGWFNGHFHRGESGEWKKEFYPIPVIGVAGLCDIELSFDKTSVTAKLTREDALTYSYSRLSAYRFEVYGVEDFLKDFYCEGRTDEDIAKEIEESNEKEIFLSFDFPTDAEQELFTLLTHLKENGFYY
ncbi:MAG: hypothetical protein IJY12_04065 [Clostridia bacterium]|nr:hypothetical protein [Clostridia bacterium]